MHHCLEISELLDEILKSCESNRAGLAALARTCRTLSGPALDLLWKVHGNLNALLATTPRDLWKETMLEVRGVQCSTLVRYLLPRWMPIFIEHYKDLTRALRRSEWDRFQVYSNRIHGLSVFTTSYNFQVAPAALRKMRDSAPTNILFPNIRTLTYQCDLMEEVELLPMFLSPSLRELHIPMEDHHSNHGPIIRRMFESITNKCPNITSLVIRSALRVRLSLDIAYAVSEFICQYNGLEVIEIPLLQLTPQAIRHIATLPKLGRLHWSPDVFESVLGSFTPTLPNLECYTHKKPQHESHNSVESFMRTFTMLFASQKKLKELVVNVVHPETPQLRRAFALIGDRLSHGALDVLDFQTKGEPRDNLAVYLTDLQPLLPFHNVQYVTLDSYRLPFNLADDAIMAMASAWPLLRCLRMTTVGTEFTLKSLSALLEKCIKLETLYLRVDFRVANSRFDKTKVMPHPQKLRFYVLDSPMDDVDHTVNVFRHFIPGLVSLSYYPVQIRKWCAISDKLLPRS